MSRYNFPHPAWPGAEFSKKAVRSESQFVVGSVGIDLQQPPSAGVRPAEWDLYEVEEEPLGSGGRLYSEVPGLGDPSGQKGEEVADERGEDHEDRVLPHERAGQVLPAEVVVHDVESPLRAPPPVIELHDLPLAAVGVVGEDAAVDVAVEERGLRVGDERPLGHEPVALFGEERGERQRGQLASLEVDFALRPAFLRDFLQPRSKRGALVGADVEQPAVGGHDLHDVLRVGAAVHARPVHLHAPVAQQSEGPLQRVGLPELHLRVAVPVLDVEWAQVDLGDSGEVAERLLVGVLCVILLGSDELVVVVEHDRGVLFHQAAEQQAVEQQPVESVVDVELVGLPRFGAHRAVVDGQGLEGFEERVRAGEAVVGVPLVPLRAEQVAVLDALPAAEVGRHEVFNNVGVGVLRVYPLVSQRVVYEVGESSLAECVYC